jgi:hypothetical protein
MENFTNKKLLELTLDTGNPIVLSNNLPEVKKDFLHNAFHSMCQRVGILESTKIILVVDEEVSFVHYYKQKNVLIMYSSKYRNISTKFAKHLMKESEDVHESYLTTLLNIYSYENYPRDKYFFIQDTYNFTYNRYYCSMDEYSDKVRDGLLLCPEPMSGVFFPEIGSVYSAFDYNRVLATMWYFEKKSKVFSALSILLESFLFLSVKQYLETNGIAYTTPDYDQIIQKAMQVTKEDFIKTIQPLCANVFVNRYKKASDTSKAVSDRLDIIVRAMRFYRQQYDYAKKEMEMLDEMKNQSPSIEKEIELLSKHYNITFKTESIITIDYPDINIAGVPLGNYTAEVDLLQNTVIFSVPSTSPVVNNDHWRSIHPHIKESGEPCYGNMSTFLESYIASFKLKDLADLLHIFLLSYNAASTFGALGLFANAHGVPQSIINKLPSVVVGILKDNKSSEEITEAITVSENEVNEVGEINSIEIVDESDDNGNPEFEGGHVLNRIEQVMENTPQVPVAL